MRIHAVDLFCGVGGLTHGLEQSGIEVVAGIDFEGACKLPYEYNNSGKFIHKDIKDVTAEEIIELYPDNTDIKVLVGCAPCQPFSSYSHRYKNKKNDKMDLLYYFGDIVKKVKPDIVSMENVPQMAKTEVFFDFLNLLEDLNYNVEWKVVFAPDYEIPQNRKRLVLVASKLNSIEILSPLRTKDNYVTVKETIGNLPKLMAGEVNKEDPLHSTRRLSELNLKRIKQSVPGRTWREWDYELLPNCYKKKSGQSYGSVYGRMEWDKPSPTITTQFIGYGNGRFGHPEQDRALSLREGAMLQTFPKNYKFVDNENYSKSKVATQIGNAVPVKLGYVIGKSILNSLEGR